MFNSSRKAQARLTASFGKMKEDAFRFDFIERYFEKKDKSASFHCLSDKTCNDLDFKELFMFVDRTTSRVGQQYLYDRLRTVPSNGEALAEQERLIHKIANDPELRVNLQLQLEKLGTDEAYYLTTLFHEAYIAEPKWFFITRLLSFTSLLSLALLPFNPQLIFVLTGVFIFNAGIHFWNKRNLYQYLASIPQLLRLNEVAKALLKSGLFQEKNRGLESSVATIDKVRNKMSFFRLTSKLESDFEILFWAVLEFFKILFLLEPLFLFGILKQLDAKRKEMEEIFSFVGYADFLISIASLRNGLDQYCVPEITTSIKTLDAQGIYHPFIVNCVANSIQVKNKSILLTGSNMSGKTSFIRTIGINAITALSLNTSFAEKFSLPRTCIYSAIRISDDLMNDKSYYFEEVLTIKEMIQHGRSSKPNLFLLDEIFKGTNTVERISAGKAVLSYLAKSDNIVFVSTHDIELADLLKEEYVLYHFSEKIDNKSIDFDFKLKEGKLKHRNAIRILEINDYPDEIIREAIEISKELDIITK
jgi:MutS domain V